MVGHCSSWSAVPVKLAEAVKVTMKLATTDGLANPSARSPRYRRPMGLFDT
jgi:hypothetical protein